MGNFTIELEHWYQLDERQPEVWIGRFKELIPEPYYPPSQNIGPDKRLSVEDFIWIVYKYAKRLRVRISRVSDNDFAVDIQGETFDPLRIESTQLRSFSISSLALDLEWGLPDGAIRMFRKTFGLINDVHFYERHGHRHGSVPL